MPHYKSFLPQASTDQDDPFVSIRGTIAQRSVLFLGDLAAHSYFETARLSEAPIAQSSHGGSAAAVTESGR